jgi:hypothetical protein
MPAAPDVTASDVATFTTRNVRRTWRPVATARHCRHRASRTLRNPVIGQRGRDEWRAGPALRRLERLGV